MLYNASTATESGWEYGGPKRSGKEIEIISHIFSDGTKLRTVLDSQDGDRTKLAVTRGGRVKLVNLFKYGSDVFVPPRRDDPRIQLMVLPSGVKPHQPLSIIAVEIGELIREIVPLTYEQLLVLGSFVVNTWTGDGLPFVPTLGICGPRNVASPILLALNLVCRYPIVVGDITPAGLLQVCSKSCPTLLIDECGLHRDAVKRLLEMSKRRGINSLQKQGVFSPSCARAIACSDASRWCEMLSQGVTIFPSGLGRLHDDRLTDPRILAWAEDLRMQLLDYDLELKSPLRPIQGEPPEDMNPREWQVLRWWGAPFEGEQEFQENLLYAIHRTSEIAPSGLPPERRACIVGLEYLAHVPKMWVCSTRRIADRINDVLIQLGEEPNVTERKAGAILTDLGFPRRKRGGEGGAYQLEFSRSVKEHIHRLISEHGGLPGAEPGSDPTKVMCPLCRKYGLVSDADIKQFKARTKPPKKLLKTVEAHGDEDE